MKGGGYACQENTQRRLGVQNADLDGGQSHPIPDQPDQALRQQQPRARGQEH